MRLIRHITLAAIAAAICASRTDAQTYPGVRFVANLTGARFNGVPGDAVGRGTAFIYADQARNRICFTITVSNIQLPAWSFLFTPHGAGQLGYMTSNLASGCMITDDRTRGMIYGLLGNYTNPSFVTVYNSQHPESPALRGNLRRG